MKVTKELFAAKACAQIWKVIEASPILTNLEWNAFRLWEKSRLLVHPYVQLDQGFVYIHVPKTAGTSLGNALGLKVKLRTSLHAQAVDVLPFLKLISPDIVAIAFVRNPYTRFVSLYNFARAEESMYHSTKNPASAPYGKHPDYDTLFDKSLEECAELLAQGKLGGLRTDKNNWHPQVDWLVDRDGKLAVDFIGRVESMDVDLVRLKKLHGIESAPVPWLNKCSDDEKPLEFTERTIELLRTYYKRDFEMLGYDEHDLPIAHAGVSSAIGAPSSSGK